MVLADGSTRLAGRLLLRRSSHGFAAAAILVGCESTPTPAADAAANAAPAIISVSAGGVELSPYSVVVFESGPNAGALDLTLYDTDVRDTLFVRVFVNYNVPDPTPPRATARASVTDAVMRSASVSMGGVCTTAEIGADEHLLLQLYVFDRAVLDSGEPLYQSVAPGGLLASQTFFLRCLPGM